MSSKIIQLKDNDGNDLYPVIDANLIVGNLDTISYSEVNDAVHTPLYNLLNAIYPVGTIYWTGKEVNPSNLFGGIWKKIEDRFILTAGDTYVNGDSGGNLTHIHGSANTQNGSLEAMIGSGQGDAYSLAYKRGNKNARFVASYRLTGKSYSTPTAVNSHNTAVHGKTASSESIPPYATRYCWQRIK